MGQNSNKISLDNFYFKRVEVRLCLKEGDPFYSPEPITSPEAATKIMSEIMSDLDREMVTVINLDAKNRPLNYNIVSIGSINQSLAPIQNIMKSAILSNAASIIVMHNHPSGEATPSQADIQVTERLIEAGKLMELPVLDHVIVGEGGNERYSFRQAHPEMFLGEFKKEVLGMTKKPKKKEEMER